MKRILMTVSAAVIGAALSLSSCSGNLMELVHDSLDPILWSQRLDAPSVTFSVFFGRTTAIAGTTIMIGDPVYPGMDPRGRAYIYRIESGEVKFVRNETLSGDPGALAIPDSTIASSIAMFGDHAAIGYYADRSGFRVPRFAIFGKDAPSQDSWGYITFEEKIDSEDRDFASSLAVADDFIAAGEPAGRHPIDPLLDMAGQVHLYIYSAYGYETWTELFAPFSSGTPDDRFGASISASGTRLLVGAPGVRNNNLVTGFAMLLEVSSSSVTIIKTLRAWDGLPGEEFGCSVSLCGDYALVGARRDDNRGSVSVYFKDQGGTDNWGLQAKLMDPADMGGDQFGTSVVINGDYAVVGAPQAGEGGVSTGCAYLYKREGTIWNMIKRIAPDEGVSGMGFGASVSLTPGYIVIGAPTSPGGGAAFVYALK